MPQTQHVSALYQVFPRSPVSPGRKTLLETPSDSQILGRGPAGQTSTKALVNKLRSEEGSLVNVQVCRIMVFKNDPHEHFHTHLISQQSVR